MNVKFTRVAGVLALLLIAVPVFELETRALVGAWLIAALLPLSVAGVHCVAILSNLFVRRSSQADFDIVFWIAFFVLPFVLGLSYAVLWNLSHVLNT